MGPTLNLEKTTLINELLITRISRSIPSELNRLIPDSAIQRGKRLRGKLLLEFSGKETRLGYELAAAMELIHLATLIHDDLLDEPEKRRGTAPLYTYWGKNIAVLYGDFLFSEAIRWICELSDGRILPVVNRAISETVKGEILHQLHKRDLRLQSEGYLNIIEKKTAFLFGVCCEIGAILRNSGEIPPQLVKEIGINIGIAYQMIDDSRDYLGNGEDESSFVDARNGVITLPLIYLLEKCSSEERLSVKNVIGNGKLGEMEKIGEIITWMKKYGSISQTLTTANDYLSEAGEIALVYKDNPLGKGLFTILDWLKEQIEQLKLL